MNVVRRVLVGVAAVAVLGPAGCGGDDDATDQTAGLDRYCALSAELDSSAQEHFAELGEGATQDDFRQAHVDFIEQNEATIEGLRDAAPDEIDDDIDAVLAGMRAQAGDDVEVTEAEVDQADERVLEFERENC